MRSIDMLFVVVLILGMPTVAGAAERVASSSGISARFAHLSAERGKPLVVRVEVDDPVGVIGKIVIETKLVGGAMWQTQNAEFHEGARVWIATFVPFDESAADPSNAFVEVRARVFGKHAGLLMELGVDEPLRVDLLSPERAEAARQVLERDRRADVTDAVVLSGWVGADGRVGTDAYARVFVAVGVPLSRRFELVVGANVGPVLGADTSRPIVFGAEVAARARSLPQNSRMSVFAEPYAAGDFHLPGAEVGGGVRCGVGLDLGGNLALETSIGGALTVWIGGDPPSGHSLGANGGLRLALRFGGASPS